MLEKIEDYNEQLKQLCESCKRSKQCDHEMICAFKKLAWRLAKTRLKRREKVGVK